MKYAEFWSIWPQVIQGEREAMIRFQAGDLVRHRGGGPVMVVEWLEDEEFLHCSWFDTTNVIHVGRIRILAVEHVSPHPYRSLERELK